MSIEDERAEAADRLVAEFQAEHEQNSLRESDYGYVDVKRDLVRDAVLFALDNGWDPAPDMSEVFQALHEAEAEAERRYPGDERAIGDLLRAAFVAGAEWGSRPF